MSVDDPFGVVFPPSVLDRPVILASSGGGDSLGALMVLHRWLQQGRIPALTVVSIDHQLHPDSTHWSATACAQAAALGVAARVKTVVVPATSRHGHRSLEARARQARYEALAECVAAEAGAVLVTAHHQQDQAETVLLALLRGSGTAGLSAMLPCQPFAGGWHWRPFLAVSSAALRATAAPFSVAPIDDPSNQESSMDRNYLRREILPRLTSRWPHAVKTLAESADGAAADRQVLQEYARMLEPDLTTDRIPLQAWSNLSRAAQANLLRTWAEARGALMPPRARLMEFLRQIQAARADRQPVLRWGPWGIQRERSALHWLAPGGTMCPVLPSPRVWQDPRQPLILADGQRWQMVRHAEVVAEPESAPELIAETWLNHPWFLRPWRADDRLRLKAGTARRRVKDLFQAQGVPVWQRRRYGLIEIDGQPAWVPGLAIDEQFRAPLPSVAWSLVIDSTETQACSETT